MDIIAIERNQWDGSLVALGADGQRAPLTAIPEGITEEEIEYAHGAVPIGVGRRLLAGLRSLVDRADLALEIVRVDEPELCSHYGDTDRIVRVHVGDAEKREGHRSASVEGDLVLHRTVGRRPEWRWGDDARLVVWPSGEGEPEVIDLRNVPRGWGVTPLLDRVVEEIAARAVEGALLLDERPAC